MRILVDHAGQKGIGDIVCEIGFYEALKREFPAAAIASRASRGLAWGNPWIDELDETSPDSAFDRVIRLGDARTTYAGLEQALDNRRTIFAHFAAKAGLTPSAEAPALYVLPEELAALGLEDDGGSELIIAYSADSVEPYRRWGEERFQAFARYLESTHRASLVELGSGVSAGHLGLGLDLVGQTDLRQSMAILSLADLFLGNHGGLTHLAGGVGTPIVSPWGASHPYWAYAYDTHSLAVETAPACRWCHWTQKPLPECVAAEPLHGRTPCTQSISVETMIAQFEQWLPRFQQARQALKQRKLARREQARHPGALTRFDRPSGFRADDYIQVYLGGHPPGWGEEHRRDNFARLKRIVAFPNWDAGDWKPLLAEYAANFQASDPWLLVLTAHPLTSTEALARLQAWVTQALRPTRPLPKILLLAGSLSPEARKGLCDSAELVAGG